LQEYDRVKNLQDSSIFLWSNFCKLIN